MSSKSLFFFMWYEFPSDVIEVISWSIFLSRIDSFCQKQIEQVLENRTFIYELPFLRKSSLKALEERVRLINLQLCGLLSKWRFPLVFALMNTERVTLYFPSFLLVSPFTLFVHFPLKRSEGSQSACTWEVFKLYPFHVLSLFDPIRVRLR